MKRRRQVRRRRASSRRPTRKFRSRSKPYKRMGVKLGRPKIKRAKAGFKKHVSSIHLASSRRFGPTRMSLSGVSSLVNSLSPCSSAFADSVANARSAQQQQGWLVMFAHTASQLNAYHTWNPTIGTTVVPTYQTMQKSTVLEANRNTLWLQNFSLNNPVCVTAYLCKPRAHITAGSGLEMANCAVTIGAGPALVFPSAAQYAIDLFTLMQNNYSQNTHSGADGFNPNVVQSIGSSKDYPGQPTSNTAVLGSDGMLIPGESLFNNKWFCQHFKILRTTKTTLKAGKRCKLTLQMPPRVLSFSNNGWIQNASGTFVSPFGLFSHSRFWMVSFHGCPVPYLSTTDGKGTMNSFDCPPAVLGMYSVEQWCIRQSPGQSEYAISQRVSAKQTLTADNVGVSFGRVKLVGETEQSGTGAFVHKAGSTMNSNIVQTF
jgi:hypothetical protein